MPGVNLEAKPDQQDSRPELPREWKGKGTKKSVLPEAESPLDLRSNE
jgi:hypothetical protein